MEHCAQTMERLNKVKKTCIKTAFKRKSAVNAIILLYAVFIRLPYTRGRSLYTRRQAEAYDDSISLWL